MKKILILVALLLAPSVALAKQGSRNLDFETKLERRCFRFPNTTTGATTPDATVGVAGLIARATTGSGPTTVNVTAPNAMPYPARVGFRLNDITSNDAAITCTGVSITGMRTDGSVRTESIGTVGTAAIVYSTHVYVRVDRVQAVCADTTDATDAFVAFASRYAWVGKKINRTADVVSACIEDISGAHIYACGTAAQITAAVTVSNSTIDLLNSAVFNGAPAADEDVVCLTVVPGFN